MPFSSWVWHSFAHKGGGGGGGGGAWDAGADAGAEIDADADAEAPCWSAFEPHHSRCEFEGFATGSACISLSGSLDGLRTRARSPTRALELPACPRPAPSSASVHAEPVVLVVAEPVERA